jgi:hypothetical protein
VGRWIDARLPCGTRKADGGTLICTESLPEIIHTSMNAGTLIGRERRCRVAREKHITSHRWDH